MGARDDVSELCAALPGVHCPLLQTTMQLPRLLHASMQPTLQQSRHAPQQSQQRLTIKRGCRCHLGRLGLLLLACCQLRGQPLLQAELRVA